MTKFLDLSKDVAELTADLIDIPSVSGHEKKIADVIEESLNRQAHLNVSRFGDAIVARTELGRSERVLLAGHLDTVPLPTASNARGTVPSRWSGETLYGRGATDMKGGVAVQLALTASLTHPQKDLTFVFYDHEEVEAAKSGLLRVATRARSLLTADLAVLLEPTNGYVEAGCNGTLRLRATAEGTAAHSARAWMGENAIHKLAGLLSALQQYEPAAVDVDGLAYREGLNAVGIGGGIAGNVIPDAAYVDINYRFAPDKTPDQAEEHVRQILAGYQLTRTDAAAGARPGLGTPAVQSLVTAVGGAAQPKYGWTDVARFAQMGIPAVNFGPGDALLAHTDDEHVLASEVRKCLGALLDWLT
ncbi:MULTISPECIES: succinyl-diaminopimelate desuccinylase [Arthrobacter]|uniref:Succinyl-diaminopimelate desuccinylase n=1 Tax=Arthrobacter terricola TaxID=2547396 RepID=A0A4R5K827_9MICC|nr:MULTISPECIES: succinyl-diaminopimelate desuccinylase [Arthrobacter]MBT8163662.1 succinyl-diaminopimelate desuccinylase [Arthrobacter sp. GN70]TDF87877.1 succinyl-diaminopimelate desuccinylase [Arthrobacter terricola]